MVTIAPAKNFILRQGFFVAPACRRVACRLVLDGQREIVAVAYCARPLFHQVDGGSLMTQTSHAPECHPFYAKECKSCSYCPAKRTKKSPLPKMSLSRSSASSETKYAWESQHPTSLPSADANTNSFQP